MDSYEVSRIFKVSLTLILSAAIYNYDQRSECGKEKDSCSESARCVSMYMP